MEVNVRCAEKVFLILPRRNDQVKSHLSRGGWITRSRDRDHPGQHGETPYLLKIQKVSWAQWRMPVIPATQEAEAGELPEPRGRRLR